MAAAAATQQNAIPRACNVEDIFHDFEGRRAGLLRALTTDVFDLYFKCHPDKENLRLYGLPDKRWEVNAPGDELELKEIPPPILGINFARDSTPTRRWISLIALYSDSWLLAVAFYYAAKSGFDKADRERLYNMINDLPTLYEIVAWKEPKTQSSTNNKGSPKVPKEEEDGSDQGIDEENGLDEDEEEELDVEEGDEAHSRCPYCNNKVKRARH